MSMAKAFRRDVPLAGMLNSNLMPDRNFFLNLKGSKLTSREIPTDGGSKKGPQGQPRIMGVRRPFSRGGQKHTCMYIIT